MLTTARLRRTGWLAMTGLATLLAVASARYFTLDPVVFLPRQVATYVAHLGPLLLHVGGGVLALAIGPWQFSSGLRARHRTVHRVLGTVYAAAAVAAAVGGLTLAPLSLGGPLAHVGFGTLAVLLLATTGIAYASIKRRRIDAHRAWMTRSYALIFAAVTFRVWLAVLSAAGLPFSEVYAVGSWTSWLVDLLAAELLLSRAAGRRREPAAAHAA
jgi:uncharacterized membrane protein